MKKEDDSMDYFSAIQKLQDETKENCVKSRCEIERKIKNFNKIEMICSLSLMTQTHFQNETTPQELLALIDSPSSYFLTGLALKEPNNSDEKPSIKDLNEVFNLLHSYFSTYPFTLIPPANQKRGDEHIVFSARSQNFIGQMNHERYPFQTEDLLTGFFYPINDYYVEKWGFSTKDAFLLSRAIIEICSQNIIEKLERIHDYDDERKIVELFSENTSVFQIDLEKTVAISGIKDIEILKKYLKALSCEFGTNNESYEDPLDENILLKKPLICHNGKYYAPIPQELVQNLPAILEDLLIVEKQQNLKIWNKYADLKAEYTENSVFTFLLRLFPKEAIFQNLFYEHQHQRCEVDTIIPYCNNVLIVEAKSGGFSDSAKRGGIKRIVTDIKKLISNAYEQGLRAKDYIESRKISEFKDAKGKDVLNLENNGKLNFILLNVTYEPLIGFSPSLKKLEKVGLFKNNEYPWSVNLFDLDIITRHIESPSFFIHYIESRLKTQLDDQITSPDELTFFGFYLQFGTLNIESYDGEKISQMRLDSSFLEKFDNYYLLQKDPPKLEIEKEIQRIIIDLEKLQPDNFTDLTNTLLNLDHTTRKKIIQWMEKIKFLTQVDGKRHDFSLMDEGNELGVTIFSQIGHSDLQMILLSYCTLKKYQCKKDKWIGLGIDILDSSYQVHAFYYNDAKWKKDRTMEDELRFALRNKMLRNSPDFYLNDNNQSSKT